MKSKFLTLLCSFLVLFSVNAHAFTLQDATSFDPIPVQIQAASIGVPIGTVIVWTKEEIPEGWLECNGQPVPDMYPDLKALMPTVPNYQGMFLRGAGSQVVTHGSYGNVVHRTTLGEIQGDTIRNITGEFDGGDISPFFKNNFSGAFKYKSSTTHTADTAAFFTGHNFKFDASLIVPTSEENRPVNVGVKYLIKAE